MQNNLSYQFISDHVSNESWLLFSSYQPHQSCQSHQPRQSINLVNLVNLLNPINPFVNLVNLLINLCKPNTWQCLFAPKRSPDKQLVSTRRSKMRRKMENVPRPDDVVFSDHRVIQLFDILTKTQDPRHRCLSFECHEPRSHLLHWYTRIIYCLIFDRLKIMLNHEELSHRDDRRLVRFEDLWSFLSSDWCLISPENWRSDFRTCSHRADHREIR